MARPMIGPTGEQLEREYLSLVKGGTSGAARALAEQYGLTESQVWNRRFKYRQQQDNGDPVLDEPTTGEMMQALNTIKRFADSTDPVITHRVFRFDDEPIAIQWSSCFHMFGRWTMHDLIQERMDKIIAHPRYLNAQLGDDIEGFNHYWFNAKSAADQLLTAPMQRKLYKRFFDEWADSTLCAFNSQHAGLWEEKTTGENTFKNMYLEAGIPFFDGQSYLTIHVGSQTYRVAAAHAFPGNSMYNPLHAVNRAVWQKYPTVDIAVQGDKHQSAYMERQVFGFEVQAGNRESPWVHLIQTGTAKTGPDPYTIRSWTHGQSEWYTTVLYPDRHEVKVTRSIDQALRWLDEI